jgi:riboflavin kinase / FMN adenylyltransferase
VNVARSPDALPFRERAVAIGTFDGVHAGHRRILDAVRAAPAAAAVVTFDPHPRAVLGSPTPLLTTLERRLELLGDAGVEDVLVVDSDASLAGLEPAEFAARVLVPFGARIVTAGVGFRFGRDGRGDLESLAKLGLDVRPVPLVDGVSSARIRELVAAGDLQSAARLLGRPFEVEGTVEVGDRRGRELGFPTANVGVASGMVLPPYGVYAGAARGRRAAVSIGVNPHFGGSEQRVEAFLLDYEDDLYGQRLVVELWQRLRDEQAFDDLDALVAQISRDVAATREAERPV